MASISLRAYNHEIEEMIDRGQNEEAVAHCMHILRSIPKHITTYRLLGKTLLEMQRYTDAVDIFKRVLSSVPDDFVTHVGMSIIRENGNNLDSAIWHMERAFESQPANAAIQDELRRLYGRRDGMEPPKIRLTRGALARMYAKGNLYQQAIGELQAALAEDSNRPDLQVLLARMYHQSNQSEQAVKVCSDILKRLPFAIEACRIMADLLTGGDKETYRQRLISLDPYYRELEPRFPTSSRVAGNAVVVDRLEYQPGQQMLPESSQPEWAGSLDAAFRESSSSALPEWVTGEDEAAAPFQESDVPFDSGEMSTLAFESGDETAIEGQESEDYIPDFLRDAGWQKSDRRADEIAMEEMQREIEAESDDIIPAEIPDWLLEMAPGDESEAIPTPPDESPDDELLPWLQEDEPGPTDSVVTWLQETKETASPEEVESLEAALKEASQPETGEETPVSMDDEIEIPSIDLEESIESSGEQEEWNIEEELPDWLRSTDQGRSGVTDDLPGWLRGEEAPDALVGEQPESEEVSTPEIDAEAHLESPVEQESDQVLEMPELETLLESEDQPADLELELEGAESEEEVPEWLQDLGEESTEGTLAQEAELVESMDVIEESTEEADRADEIPDWLQGLEIEPEPETVGIDETIAAEVAAATSESELLDEDTAPWSITPDKKVPAEPALSLEQVDSVEEADIDIEPVDVDTPEIEPSMEQISEDAGEPDETVVQEPAHVGFDLDDPEAAMAWLESLAEKQGAAADQLTSDPDARPETPDWLMETVEDAQSSGEIPTYEPTETVEGFVQPLEVDSGEREPAVSMGEMETAPKPPESEAPVGGDEVGAEAISTDEIPEWLQDLESEGDILTETAEDEPVLEMDGVADLSHEALFSTEDVPDWLSEPESEEEMGFQEAVAQDSVEEITEEPVDDLTEWLSSLDAEDTEAEAATGLTAAEIAELEAIELSEEDTAPVAVRKDAPTLEEPPIQETVMADPVSVESEEEPSSETVAEQQPEAGFDLDDPDAAMAWLESLAEQQGVDADQLTTSPEDRPGTPDWLLDSVEEAQSSGDIPTYEPTETVEGLAQPSTEDIDATAAEVTALEIPESAEEQQELPEPAGLDETDEPIAAAEIPEWLQEMEPEPAVGGGIEALPTDDISSEEPLTEEALEMDELSEEKGEIPEPAPLDATVISQGIPDWLQEIEPDEVEAEAQPDETVAAEELFAEEAGEPETLPDWLLESEEGVELQPGEPELLDEEMAPEPEVESEIDETVLQQEPVEAVFEEIDTGVEASVEDEDVPDWLKEPEEEPEEALEWMLESDLAAEQFETEPEPEPLSAEIDEVEISQAQTVISSRELAELAEAQPEELLDINTASLSELEDLPGIGFVLAQSIINFRDENGPFDTLEDLEQVDGIGSVLREQLANWIHVVAEPISEPVEEKREPETEDEATLMGGQKEIKAGDIRTGLEKFDGLIQKDLFLEEIIQTLTQSLSQKTGDSPTWEVLGDAYMRSGQLQKALEAYGKAEELLG